MKTLIFILSLLTLPVFAGESIITIHTHKDSKGTITGYQIVYGAFYPNGSAKTVDYKAGEDATKIVAVMSKEDSGLTKDDDRTTIFLLADGTVSRVLHEVFSQTRNDAAQKAQTTNEKATEVSALKAEIDVKPETVKVDVATVKADAAADAVADSVEPINP